MLQLLYKLIYNQGINYILRNINRALCKLVPLNFKIPPSGKLVFKIHDDLRVKFATNQTSYITYLLYWEGGLLNFEYTDIFLKLIKKIHCFYDVGANIGYYSLLAAKMNNKLRIVAFEPAKGSLHFLKKNIQINEITNIDIESLALSDSENEEIIFYEVKNSKYKYLKYNLAGEGNTGSKTKERDFVKNKVKTMTLDGMVKLKKETGIDLIKMDTEGTENLILKKSDYVLRTMKPIVICETLFNRIEKDLEENFKSYGYEFYNHINKGLRKQKSIIRKEDDGIRNCFFVHPSKFHLIEEFVIN